VYGRHSAPYTMAEPNMAPTVKRTDGTAMYGIKGAP